AAHCFKLGGTKMKRRNTKHSPPRRGGVAAPTVSGLAAQTGWSDRSNCFAKLQLRLRPIGLALRVRLRPIGLALRVRLRPIGLALRVRLRPIGLALRVRLRPIGLALRATPARHLSIKLSRHPSSARRECPPPSFYLDHTSSFK